MAGWFARHPWMVLLGALAIGALGATRIPGIGRDDDMSHMWAAGGRESHALEGLEKAFGSSATTVAVIVQSHEPLDAPLVAAVAKASNRIAGLGGVEEVLSITRTDIPYTEGDTVVVAPLFGPNAKLKAPLPERVKRLHAMGSLGQRLLSDDGRTLLIAAQTDATFATNGKALPIARKIRDIANDTFAPLGKKVTVRFVGVPFTRLAAARVVARDPLDLALLALAAIFVVALFAFRSLRAAAVAVAAAAVVDALLLGLMHQTDRSLDPLTIVLPAVVTALAGGLAMVLTARYVEPIDGDATPAERGAHAMRAGGAPVLLAAVGAAVGFGSLLLTRASTLRTLGTFGAVGAALSLVIVWWVVPAGLTALRMPGWAQARQGARGAARWVTTGGKPLIVGVVGIAMLAAAAWVARGLVIDDYLSRVLPPDHPVSEGSRIVDRKLGGMIPVEVDLQGEPDTFKEPDHLSRLARLEDRVRKHADARFAVSLASVVEQVYQAFGGTRSIPDDQATIEQLLLLSGSRQMQDVVTTDFGHARLLFYTRDEGSHRMRALHAWVAKQAKALFGGTGIRVRVTGISEVASSMLPALRGELLAATGVCVAALFLVLGLASRSLRFTLLSPLPALLAVALAGMGYALWWGPGIGPIPAAAFPIALGLAAFPTIVLATRHAQARRATPGSAVETAVASSLLPMTAGSITLAAGFACLALGGFPANATFGALIAASMLLSLATTLLITPPLLPK